MTENRFWQMLSILVVIVTAAIPAYVAYDLYKKGPTPEKKIEIYKMSLIDPMYDLAALGDEVALSLKIRNQSTDNFIIAKDWIRNSGNAPILPTDYYEKISINVPSPWKILAVENTKDSPRSVSFEWKKINDTKFEAEPALLNPGDIVSTNIYLTYVEMSNFSDEENLVQPEINWKARIINMQDFTNAKPLVIGLNMPGDKSELTIHSIAITLSGFSLIFIAIVSTLFFTVYIYLLNISGYLIGMKIKSILFIVLSGFLSIAASESFSTYLFTNRITEMYGVYHIINAPWIILHVIFLLFLYRKAQSKM